jgi:hypothetical protein
LYPEVGFSQQSSHPASKFPTWVLIFISECNISYPGNKVVFRNWPYGANVMTLKLFLLEKIVKLSNNHNIGLQENRVFFEEKL